MKKTADTLMVSPINDQKLLAYVSMFYTPDAPNKEIRVPKLEAVYDDNVIIDHDSCYEIVPNKLFEGKVQPVWEYPIKIIEKKEGGYSIPIIPTFYFSISIEKLKELCDVDKSLKEFIRFDYNPRITQNTREFLEAVNE